MGQINVIMRGPDGIEESIGANYQDIASDGHIAPEERTRALAALANVVEQNLEHLRRSGVGLATDVEVTLSETRPSTCWISDSFCPFGDPEKTAHDTINPPPAWRNSVMQLLGQRVSAEAGSPTELRERFSQYVMQAGSVIGWDGEGLYERIVASQQPVLGAIRQEQIDRWKGGEDFPIVLPQLTDQELEGIKAILARNTRTTGRDQTQLAQEFQEIHDKIKKATDPTQNLTDPMHPGETGADGDLTTLSAVEVKDLGDFLVDEDDWDKKTIKEDVLKMVAAYLSIVNFYREMSATE